MIENWDILRISLRTCIAAPAGSQVSFVNRVKICSMFAVEGRKIHPKLSAESGCEFVEPEW